MKKVILMAAMVLPMCCFGQTLDSLDMPVLDGKVGFQKVVTLDSVSAKDIMQRAKLYFTEKYESGKDVIQLADEGVIIGKGITSIQFVILLTAVKIDMKYLLRIEAKDNRYRYSIQDISTKGANEVSKGNEWQSIEDWWRYPKRSKQQRKLFGEEIRATGARLEAYIQKPSVSKSDKW